MPGLRGGANLGDQVGSNVKDVEPGGRHLCGDAVEWPGGESLERVGCVVFCFGTHHDDGTGQRIHDAAHSCETVEKTTKSLISDSSTPSPWTPLFISRTNIFRSS